MADAHTGVARWFVDTAVREMREALDGLPGEALNWAPLGEGTNSPAVLVQHTMGSTRMWLSAAVGAPLPERDRDTEFTAKADDAPTLIAWLKDIGRECVAVLADPGDVDWSAAVPVPNPAPDEQTEVPAIWALMHAIGHLREHVGQLQLTRQLWDARG